VSPGHAIGLSAASTSGIVRRGPRPCKLKQLSTGSQLSRPLLSAACGVLWLLGS